MNNNWPVITLKNYCLKIGSGATPKGGNSVYHSEGEICLIRSQNVYNEGFRPDGLVYINEESANKLKNVIVEKNDILLNITGDSVARVCLVKEKYLPSRVNQHVAIIRVNPIELDARFVRYFLASSKIQNLLLIIASSGATRNALTKSMIEQLEVPKPKLEIQKSIADKLSLLDDKILLNTQINQTLESMAQAIFKSWFVDFEPVKAKIAAIEAGEDTESVNRAAMRAISGRSDDELDQMQAGQPDDYAQLKDTAELFPAAMWDSELGEVPEGWGIESIYEIANVIYGAPFKSKLFNQNKNGYPLIRIRDLKTLSPSNYTTENHPKGTLVYPGDVLVGMDAEFTPWTWLGEIGYLNQRVCMFKPTKNHIHKYFIYQAIKPKLKFFENANVGTTVIHLGKADINSFEVLTPNKDIFKSFYDIIDPIFSHKISNSQELRTLSNLRDTLLPKLLSGELSVENIEINNADI